MNKEIPVEKLMTTEVITVSPNDTMDRVQEIFRGNAIHHIPVVQEGRVVGILSEKDYLRLLHGFTLFKNKQSEAFNDAVLRSLLVGEVMTRQVATVKASDTAEVAVGFFRENLFHALPVLNDKGQLVGILTSYDLLCYAFSNEAAVET